MREVHEVHTHSDAATESAAADRGAASGMLLGLVLVLLVLAIGAFLFFGGAFRPTSGPAQTEPSGPTNIQVNPPSAPPKVDVKVDAPVQQAPSQPAPAQPAPVQPAPAQPGQKP
jgi:hypothetical protein